MCQDSPCQYEGLWRFWLKTRYLFKIKTTLHTFAWIYNCFRCKNWDLQLVEYQKSGSFLVSTCRIIINCEKMILIGFFCEVWVPGTLDFPLRFFLYRWRRGDVKWGPNNCAVSGNVGLIIKTWYTLMSALLVEIYSLLEAFFRKKNGLFGK